MADSLGAEQKIFSLLAANLIIQIYRAGYQVSFGESKRSDEQSEINAIGETGRKRVAQLLQYEYPVLAEAIRNNGKANGIRNSAHRNQLAIDLNLFKDGVYLADTEAHRQFGEWWERQYELCRWGGRWGDGNHYSIEFNGVK